MPPAPMGGPLEPSAAPPACATGEPETRKEPGASLRAAALDLRTALASGDTAVVERLLEGLTRAALDTPKDENCADSLAEACCCSAAVAEASISPQVGVPRRLGTLPAPCAWGWGAVRWGGGGRRVWGGPGKCPWLRWSPSMPTPQPGLQRPACWPCRSRWGRKNCRVGAAGAGRRSWAWAPTQFSQPALCPPCALPAGHAQGAAHPQRPAAALPAGGEPPGGALPGGAAALAVWLLRILTLHCRLPCATVQCGCGWAAHNSE